MFAIALNQLRLILAVRSVLRSLPGLRDSLPWSGTESLGPGIQQIWLHISVLTCVLNKQTDPDLSSLICEMGIIIVLLCKVSGRIIWEDEYRVFGCHDSSLCPQQPWAAW